LNCSVKQFFDRPKTTSIKRGRPPQKKTNKKLAI